MKYINHSSIIQIEVTEVCGMNCSHCTRATNLLCSPKHHSLDYIEQSLRSLANWKGIVGCFGGEPTTHPQFKEVCELYRKYRPRKRSGLWTSGGKIFDENLEIINKTFGLINKNNHSDKCFHRPPFIAIEEMISNTEQRTNLIKNCWVHHLWSAIITPSGAYFCEVAATIDKLIKGNLGVSIEPGWINNPLLAKQKELLCQKCGMAIETSRYDTKEKNNYISPLMLQHLQRNNDLNLKDCALINNVSQLPTSKISPSTWSSDQYLLNKQTLHFQSPFFQKILFYKNKILFFLQVNTIKRKTHK